MIGLERITQIQTALTRTLPTAIVATVFALVVPTNLSAATITVPDDYPTIQQAINAAIPADTVYVRAGTYYEHVTIGKSLTLQGEDRETTIIDGGATGKVVTAVSTSNVTVSGFTVRNGGSSSQGYDKDAGIALRYTSYSLISDCIVTSNGLNGLYAYQSSYNTVQDCEFCYNQTDPIGGIQGAIHLRFSLHNTIADNKIYSNTSYSVTVRSWSQHTTITRNDVYSNGGPGIHVGWSSHCTIVDNTVHDNPSSGVFFDATSYNTVRDNTICSNSFGIRVSYYAQKDTFVGNVIRGNGTGIIIGGYALGGHVFYHNDIVDNTVQCNISAPPSIWDNGYPSGGNYWSDYVGVDEFKGPGQNIPGSDGIGDIPYVIDSQNSDRYPLMTPVHCIQAAIDIKPGSYPNSINLGSKGVIPVAILSTQDFDATTVDAGTVALAGAGVAVRGKSDKLLAREEDVNGDGLPDLVCQVETENLDPDSFQDGYAILTGNLLAEFGGTPIEGKDEISIVPPE